MSDESYTYILGCDPGFASFGYSVTQLRKDSYELIEAEVFRTAKATTKVLVSIDNMRRAQLLAEYLGDVIDTYGPSVIVTEGMSFPQNSSAAVKLALAWGVLAGLISANDLPVVQVSPQNIKKQLCGKRNASKLEVEAAVRAASPTCGEVLDAIPRGRRDHPVDAFGATICALDSEVVRMARRML